MKSVMLGLALPVLVTAMTTASAQTTPAEKPLVFISSFAGAGEGGIQAFKLDPDTGSLTPTHRTTGVENPFFLALSPDRRFLYSIHAAKFGGTDNEQIAAFQVLNRSGELKPLNRQSSRGTASCYLDVDATGKSLVVANYSSGSVASLPIAKDGSLGEAATFEQHVGSSVNPARQTAPHAHSIVVSPDNRFAYSADLGLDQILCYKLDAVHAQLKPNHQSFVRTPPGAGPRHLTFSPNGKHLYAINEMGNSVTLFDYDGKTGVLIERQTLSTLPKNFTGESYCADLKITPDGRFLFGTNRGHDSIASYRIAEDGRLTLLGIDRSLGKGPQNLAITPGGRYLLCANMPGNNVAVFRIDAQSGALISVGPPIELKGPSCIKIVP